MCGIAGFSGRGDPAVLRAMTTAIRHRGPDAEGLYRSPEGDVHLGHRRLSIIDLECGAQPMSTPDGALTIVFNGEIYNHAELREQLAARGHGFRTDHSDTEVLLFAYREWGDRMLERLNGMWSFVIHDRVNARLFGARDRFGKKPLAYFATTETFAFASELSALLAHPDCPQEVSRDAEKKYFAYGYIPSPATILKGVHKLPPGHAMSLDLRTRSLRVHRYWELVLEPFERTPADPIREWGGELRRLLEEACRRRLMSDVPLGVFLSGGIDSSAIAALAGRNTSQLRTFSMGFTEPSFDELPFARATARALGVRNDAEVLDLDTAREFLPNLIADLDEPLADSSLLPTWLLSRFARRHVTVALGGDGGDELFAGYDPFRALGMAQAYRTAIPGGLHPAVHWLANRLPVSHRNLSTDFKIKRTLLGLGYPPALWHPVWLSPLDPVRLSRYFGEPVDPEWLYSEAIEAWDASPRGDPVARSLQFYSRLYMSEGVLTKVDRASMMHGLEVRNPFLDIEVVNFARRIPSSWKLRRGVTKFLLKEALRGVVPDEVIDRAKKGFGTPVGAWLRSGALAPEGSGSVNPPFVRDAISEHRRGRRDDRLFLWAEWVLENWKKTHLHP